jgi:hypothetical protein
MPKFRQALNGGDALRVRLPIRPVQILEPIENRDISFGILVEDNISTRH